MTRFATMAVDAFENAPPPPLVVLSTRGHGGVRRWLLGSVAEKLVRAAAAPILLVRDPGANGPAGEATPTA